MRLIWFVALLVAVSPLVGAELLNETFSYADGPLAGQGAWARGVASPTADNPSSHLVVSGGAVRFDWTVATPVNNAVRLQWSEAQLTEGVIYAAFDFHAEVAPQEHSDVRPGFLHFDQSGGGQVRGIVGLRPGTEPGTVQLGVSASSQQGTSFRFAERDLAVGETTRVLMRYHLGTAETTLWIGTDDPAQPAAAVATGSPGAGVRRIQFRLYNNDGSNGTTRLGIFRIDNLVVWSAEAPDPGPNPVDPSPGTEGVLLAETFAYEDGPLLEDAPGWRARSGEPRPKVTANRLELRPAATGAAYVTRNLSQGVASGEVHTGFTVELPAVAVPHEPARILFLTDASGGLTAGHVALEGTAGGWRIGVSGSMNGTVTWAPDVLAAGSSSRWVATYHTGTGGVGLWRSTDAAGAPARAQATGTAREVRRLALGGDAHLPEPPLVLRDLHVATSRTQAAAPPVDIVTLPHRDKVFAFLLIGQSNMAGRGAVTDADRIGNRRIVYLNADRQWQVARDPLHFDHPTAPGVGPGLHFARALLPELPPDAVIALVPAAQGATSITSWDKNYSGGNLFYGGQYLYPHALSRARQAAGVGTLAGILWNQGENDAGAAENDGGASYRTRLHRLIADLRADLGRPDLPFLVSTLGPWRTNANAINAVFLNLPNEVPHTAVVNTLDPAVRPLLVNNPNDTPHYLSPSYRLLGQLYAEAFAPWWQPEPAFVREVGGGIEAGGRRLRARFAGSGSLVALRAGDVPLLAAAAAASGEWWLSGSATPEAVTLSLNPPLSLKWRSPRTMAAWTASRDSLGVVLANNDLQPATFRLTLSGSSLTHWCGSDGAWRTAAAASGEQEVTRLRWSLPDGSTVLWRGLAWLRTAGGGDWHLDAVVASGDVVDWEWHAGEIAVARPQPFAVLQRQTARQGRVPVEGLAPPGATEVVARIASGSSPYGPVADAELRLPVDPVSGAFRGTAIWPAGGWYVVELSARDAGGGELQRVTVDPVGIGEVFVVAGQSNATNSGQERTFPQSGLVATYSGSGWRTASDPQPGTHDNADRGSFQPALGDALAASLGVPVGFASTGQGGSGIRHWQPDYAPDFTENTFYNGLHAWTAARMRQLGPGGFRALLWHQGESNAARGASNDPGKVTQYAADLTRVLGTLRSAAGWNFPAMTAQASLWPVENAAHGGDPYLRLAQQAVWEAGIALQGPDTDTLGLEYRQNDNESRVHFNAAGLKRHGELWAERLLPWIAGENLRSLLPAVRIRSEAGVLRLEWEQAAGLDARLERSTSPAGPWVELQRFQTGGTDGSFSVPQDEPVAPASFYRLRLIE